jgi:hypothetical protein
MRASHPTLETRKPDEKRTLKSPAELGGLSLEERLTDTAVRFPPLEFYAPFTGNQVDVKQVDIKFRYPEEKPDCKVGWHFCDFCEGEFECKTRRMVKNVGIFCDCPLQFVLAVEKPGECSSRLAFWCSEICYDEDFPQDDTEEDNLSDDPDVILDYVEGPLAAYIDQSLSFPDDGLRPLEEEDDAQPGSSS